MQVTELELQIAHRKYELGQLNNELAVLARGPKHPALEHKRMNARAQQALVETVLGFLVEQLNAKQS